MLNEALGVEGSLLNGVLGAEQTFFGEFCIFVVVHVREEEPTTLGEGGTM